MTPKEALKGIKQAIAEHLHKQTGVNVKKHFEYLKNDTEISIVEQALNELERLKKFKETFDNYELFKKQDFIAFENWLECEAELNSFPTVDELCKALRDFTNWEVKYSTETKQFYHRLESTECTMYITETYGDGNWTLGAYLPPHLITLIGRFYEGLK